MPAPQEEPHASRTASARRTIAAATVGNALEFYDFITYSFFAIQIGRALFPAEGKFGSLLLSLATFGVGFVTRPIGGIVIGAYSDRAGRRPAMMLSFTLMGGAIVAMALIPPYTRIGVAAPILAVIARMVMGFSLGGEVGPNTAYLLESAPVKKRGLMVSWQGASQNISATVGGVVGVLLSATMSSSALDSYGWRIAFLLGAVTVPFGLWVRRGLPETLHNVEESAFAVAKAAATRLGTVREHWKIVGLSVVILAAGTISTYVTDYMTTFAQDTLQIASGPAFGVTVVSNVAGIIGTLYGGWASDRFGRRALMIWPNLICLLMTYPVFLWIVHSRSVTALFVGMGVLNLFSNMPFGAFLAAMTESLPKNIRGGAVATIYAVSIAAFGGTCQFVIRWLIGPPPGHPMAPAWYLLVATVFGQIAMQFFPESAPAVREGGPLAAESSPLPDPRP